MNIELRNYKQFTGREGYGFSATLYIDGKARGNVFDDANGGCLGYEDHAAAKEVEDYAKQFPTEFDFEQGDQLINALAARADAAKQLNKYFRESLCFVDVDGIVKFTKAIKGDVEATKARWMADPKTKANLKVKKFITDKDELFELYFAQEEDLYGHPALVGAKKAAVVTEKVVQPAAEEKVAIEATKPEKKFSAEKSKMEICREIFDGKLSRKDMIAKFVAVGGCTPAGAATYYQKLKAE